MRKKKIDNLIFEEVSKITVFYEEQTLILKDYTRISDLNDENLLFFYKLKLSEGQVKLFYFANSYTEENRNKFIEKFKSVMVSGGCLVINIRDI